jgi:hypothetical protein
MSVVFATQLTAAATLALAILAFFAALLAAGAFWAQYRQLKEGFLERKREAQERRRAQALHVYLEESVISPTSDSDQYKVWSQVYNTSLQLVYDLRYIWQLNGRRPDDGYDDFCEAFLMPGKHLGTEYEVPATSTRH